MLDKSKLPLGRRISKPDTRNRLFAEVLEPLQKSFFPTGLPEGSRYYRHGPILDQGLTGTCVAHGCVAKLNGGPVMQPLKGMTVFDLYRMIVKYDEFSDNDFEATAPDDQLQSGTSVHGAMKVLKSLGYISSYLWAENTDNVRNWHLAGLGGTVLGINWTEDMMNVDEDGFASYSGELVGGHCVASVQWNDHKLRNGKKVPALRCQNSWGTEWGQGGFFWIEASDLDKLIADDGEVVAATELRLK